MKTSSEGRRESQNRLLSICGRGSETMEWLELREVVSGMKQELQCLLRGNIRLKVSDTSDAGYRLRALRCDIEDLIRHLVLDARDAMPGGGELRVFTGKVALDAKYARTHPEVPPGNYAMLAICDTGDGSNAESLAYARGQSRHSQGPEPRTHRLLRCHRSTRRAPLCVAARLRNSDQGLSTVLWWEYEPQLSSFRQRLTIFDW